jgi:hypothetical protein
MFTRGSGFAPQLPELSTGWPPDPSQMPPAPFASELFPERVVVPEVRPHVKKLMDAPQSTERDALLNQYLVLCETIEQFIVRSKSERAIELQLQYDAQWVECRRLETEISRVASEIGNWQSSVNARSMAMSKISDQFSEIPKPATRFPSQQEIAEYNSRREAIKQELSREDAEIRKAKLFIGGLENTHRELAKSLSTGVEALEALRAQMNALKD